MIFLSKYKILGCMKIQNMVSVKHYIWFLSKYTNERDQMATIMSVLNKSYYLH